MGVDEGNLQIIDVDMTLEICSVTIVIQDQSNNRTIPQYILSCSVVHKNVMILQDWQ